MRIGAGLLKELFLEILLSRNIDPDIADLAAENFTQTSVDGVYSHGINRFPRIVDYLDRGVIDGWARPSCTVRLGALERWDGCRGMGNANAKWATDRACGLAREFGIGIVALGNTNHWLRGGAYGWQAADQGMIGLFWTNTMPNTCAWGASEACIGNNPFVIAIPQSGGRHVVVDCAMSQFAYGKMEQAKLNGEHLPVHGGWDSGGKLTDDPGEIMETMRLLPTGYWKGSGISIALDLAAAILSGGNTVTDIGRKYEDETGLSQVFIAIDPRAAGTAEKSDETIAQLLHGIQSAAPMEPGGHIYYPGERVWTTRQENLEKGVPVQPPVWEAIQSLRPDKNKGTTANQIGKER